MACLLAVKILLILGTFVPSVTADDPAVLMPDEIRPETFPGLWTWVQHLQDRVQELDDKLNSIGTVAFDAVYQNGSMLTTQQIFRFNRVKLNDGNGYDPASGIFTVPDGGSGLYYIHVYLSRQSTHFFLNHLKRNGQTLNKETLCRLNGNNNGKGSSDVATATCSVTVRLNAGDRVYVQQDPAANGSWMRLYAWQAQCVFTGFLIKPEN